MLEMLEQLFKSCIPVAATHFAVSRTLWSEKKTKGNGQIEDEEERAGGSTRVNEDVRWSKGTREKKGEEAGARMEE